MPSNAKSATETEVEQTEVEVEAKAAEMSRGDSTPFALAVEAKVLASKQTALRKGLSNVLASFERFEGGAKSIAPLVMDLRLCFTKTVAVSKTKTVEVHDIDGASPAYREKYGEVIGPLLKGLDPKAVELLRKRIAYHAQTLRDAMVADGRIDKAEVLALGLKSSKQTRAAERAAEKRAATAAALAEAETLVKATKGDAVAAMEQVLHFVVDVREKLEASETLGAFGGEGYTSKQFQTWAMAVMTSVRDLAVTFERKGYGLVFSKTETKVETKVETKPASRKRTAA